MKTMLSEIPLRELLDYDPENGELRWKERDKSHFKTARDCRAWNTAFVGRRAGRIHHPDKKFGYIRRSLCIKGSEYIEHRVVWAWMTGEEPPACIDHINHDATDNRWCNLRDGVGINDLSHSKKVNNTSGVTGVHWDSSRSKWMVLVRVGGGKRINGGRYDSLEAASERAEELRAMRGYDASHGAELAHYHVS